ncbi:hypothetical protein [Succinimonas sp.]|uniref:hypothetical protein n=1 Tax=Succinimonas sp. TaxID=1936151 RepID=UPI003869D030
MKNSFTKLSIAVVAAMGLSACGGHSHSSNNNTQNEEDDSVYFDAQVVDGPIENACGFVDLNLNFQQDEGESRACTNYEGKGVDKKVWFLVFTSSTIVGKNRLDHITRPQATFDFGFNR